MKTVTFLEACKILSEKGCEEIEDEFGALHKMHNGFLTGVHSELISTISIKLILGSWKLIGKKRKIVIENVGWHANESGLIFPDTKSVYNWRKNLNQPNMKMTLEWEEED